MKTIQMTIDDELLTEMDRAIMELQTTRSAFVRDALQLALRQHALKQDTIRQLERQQAEGYTRHPVAPSEFDVWESEQVWEES